MVGGGHFDFGYLGKYSQGENNPIFHKETNRRTRDKYKYNKDV